MTASQTVSGRKKYMNEAIKNYNSRKVNSKGGNQYDVTIGDETRTVDLDGCTVMSDEDYAEVDAAGLATDDMWSPDMWNLTDENDYFFRAALEHAANYSGFNSADYIADKK